MENGLKMSCDDLRNMAKTLRKHVIRMIGTAGSGHPGGSLSVVDVLVVLYFDEMNIDPQNPLWEDRDRLVLCKGHAAPALYAALAERGYFNPDELMTLRRFNSHLQGHPDMRSTKGVDMSTGSLGQGLSAANGMAIAAKLDKSDRRIYAILGDGELEEGEIWEAAMTSHHRKLDNLTVFVDNNGLQIDGDVKDVKSVNKIADKFKAFGWNALEIDGHSIEEIKEALKSTKDVKEAPSVIVCKTIKGKGVSFMENQIGWHGNAPNLDQMTDALAELEF